MDTPTSLYRHFNKKNILLYVGISKDPFKRYTEHSRQSSWMKKVSSVTIEWHKSRLLALKAEGRAIMDEKPIYNVVGNPSKKSILKLVKGGIGINGKTALVTPIRLSRRAEKILDCIKKSSPNHRQLISDILFVHSKQRSLFDEFYRNSYYPMKGRSVVNIPSNGDIYSHFKVIEYHCPLKLERTIEALFLFYDEHGCIFPDDAMHIRK